MASLRAALRRSLARLGPSWAVSVFVLALAARVGFWLLSDQPLIYRHQNHYFGNGLRIALDPHPLRYLLTSDGWRTWEGWTIAPLYYVFEGAVFGLFGLHLGPLRLIQCVLGAITAVAVADMGRELVGPRGAWAGAAYAVYGYSVELPMWTMTENLHVALLVVAMALVLRGVSRPSPSWTAAGGFLIGVSALARSVSSAFLPLAGLWHLAFADRGRRWRGAAVLVLAGAAAVLPWAARNAFLLGEIAPIETAFYENLWYHNADPGRFDRQLAEIRRHRDDPGAMRSAALRFTLGNLRRDPAALVGKSWVNFWHFLRPEGLNNLLVVERALEPWRHVFVLVFEDAFLALLTVPLIVFLLAGRRSAAWALILLWIGYYVFMLVVAFGNEVPRYRSAFVPFALVGAAGGVQVLADRAAWRRWVTWAALALGAWLAVGPLVPYMAPAWRALAAERALRPALAAVDRGDLPEAERLAADAASLAPASPRPWLEYARRLAFAGHTDPAIAAYRRAEERADRLPSGGSWVARLALPGLLREAGRSDEAEAALAEADLLSWTADPWLALEAAWRELPPPRADEIRLGDGDYGAVRGFYQPRPAPRIGLEWRRYAQAVPPGPHRWSRGRAWLRLVPLRTAAAYDVTLEMGSPLPSPLTAPEVTVTAGAVRARFTLGPEIRPYTLHAVPRSGDAMVVRLDAPTWSLPGEPADQGVRVDRMTVSPSP